MIRVIITALMIVVELLLAAIALLVAYIAGKFNESVQHVIVQKVIDIFMNSIKFVSGCKVTYKGLDRIPKDTAVMYVGNHASFFDVILTYPILPGYAGYIAKKEFEKVPILSHAMKLHYSVFLDRNSVKDGMKTILNAIENIKSGASMFIFPEGTRSRDGNMAEFKEGSMKIAVKTGCPIIPVAISNTAEVFENHLPKLKPAPVIIEFCEPVYATDYDKDEQKHLGRIVKEIVEETRNKNNEELGVN